MDSGRVTVSVTEPVPANDNAAALVARLDAAEGRLSEALALTRQVVGQLDQAHRERGEALAQVAALQVRLDAALAEVAAQPVPQPTAYDRALSLGRRAMARYRRTLAALAK